MKFEIQLYGFHGTRVGVYHPFGTAWGKLITGEDGHAVKTEVDSSVPCELLPITKFSEDDIEDLDVKMGVLFITLKKGRFVTSRELGTSWTCDQPMGEGPCVYDLENDVAADQCLYCGQPFERK
jgi:hypothetical protein